MLIFCGTAGACSNSIWRHVAERGVDQDVCPSPADGGCHGKPDIDASEKGTFVKPEQYKRVLEYLSRYGIRVCSGGYPGG